MKNSPALSPSPLAVNLLWLVDPTGSQGMYSPWLRTAFFIVPHALFAFACAFLLSVWRRVALATSAKQRLTTSAAASSKLPVGKYAAPLTALAALLTATVVVSCLLHSRDGMFDADGELAAVSFIRCAYGSLALLFTCLGSVFGRRFYALLLPRQPGSGAGTAGRNGTGSTGAAIGGSTAGPSKPSIMRVLLGRAGQSDGTATSGPAAPAGGSPVAARSSGDHDKLKRMDAPSSNASSINPSGEEDRTTAPARRTLSLAITVSSVLAAVGRRRGPPPSAMTTHRRDMTKQQLKTQRQRRLQQQQQQQEQDREGPSSGGAGGRTHSDVTGISMRDLHARHTNNATTTTTIGAAAAGNSTPSTDTEHVANNARQLSTSTITASPHPSSSPSASPPVAPLAVDTAVAAGGGGAASAAARGGALDWSSPQQPGHRSGRDGSHRRHAYAHAVYRLAAASALLSIVLCAWAAVFGVCMSRRYLGPGLWLLYLSTTQVVAIMVAVFLLAALWSRRRGGARVGDANASNTAAARARAKAKLLDVWDEPSFIGSINGNGNVVAVPGMVPGAAAAAAAAEVPAAVAPVPTPVPEASNAYQLAASGQRSRLRSFASSWLPPRGSPPQPLPQPATAVPPAPMQAQPGVTLIPLELVLASADLTSRLVAAQERELEWIRCENVVMRTEVAMAVQGSIDDAAVVAAAADDAAAGEAGAVTDQQQQQQQRRVVANPLRAIMHPVSAAAPPYALAFPRGGNATATIPEATDDPTLTTHHQHPENNSNNNNASFQQQQGQQGHYVPATGDPDTDRAILEVIQQDGRMGIGSSGGGGQRNTSGGGGGEDEELVGGLPASFLQWLINEWPSNSNGNPQHPQQVAARQSSAPVAAAAASSSSSRPAPRIDIHALVGSAGMSAWGGDHDGVGGGGGDDDARDLDNMSSDEDEDDGPDGIIVRMLVRASIEDARKKKEQEHRRQLRRQQKASGAAVPAAPVSVVTTAVMQVNQLQQSQQQQHRSTRRTSHSAGVHHRQQQQAPNQAWWRRWITFGGGGNDDDEDGIGGGGGGHRGQPTGPSNGNLSPKATTNPVFLSNGNIMPTDLDGLTMSINASLGLNQGQQQQQRYSVSAPLSPTAAAPASPDAAAATAALPSPTPATANQSRNVPNPFRVLAAAVKHHEKGRRASTADQQQQISLNPLGHLASVAAQSTAASSSAARRRARRAQLIANLRARGLPVPAYALELQQRYNNKNNQQHPQPQDGMYGPSGRDGRGGGTGVWAGNAQQQHMAYPNIATMQPQQHAQPRQKQQLPAVVPPSVYAADDGDGALAGDDFEYRGDDDDFDRDAQPDTFDDAMMMDALGGGSPATAPSDIDLACLDDGSSVGTSASARWERAYQAHLREMAILQQAQQQQHLLQLGAHGQGVHHHAALALPSYYHGQQQGTVQTAVQQLQPLPSFAVAGGGGGGGLGGRAQLDLRAKSLG